MQFIKANTDRPCLDFGGLEAFAVAGNVIWGALVSFNALVCISMDTWKVQFVARFPEEEPDAIRLFGGAAYYQGKVFFCPMRAKNIVVYDTEKRSFYAIPLDMEIVKNNKVYKADYKTEDIVLYNDYAYIIGCSYPAIIRISLQDMSVKYITQPFEELDKRIVDYSSGYFGGVTWQDGYLYAGCCLSGDILKFSLENETYELIRTNFKKINTAIETENMFLLTSLTDLRGYARKKNDICYNHIENLDNALVVKAINKMKSVYLFCFNSEENGVLFRYDLATNKVEAVTEVKEGFYNAVEFGNKIFATFHASGITHASGRIIEINTEKRTIEEHILTYSGTILRRIMKEKETLIIENEKKGLKKFLEWMVQMNEV